MQFRTIRPRRPRVGLVGLCFGALGVVFGDIGTSPLYAINEIFFGRAKVLVTPTHIVNLISLVVWALVIVVAFKYVFWVLKADNDGEGGVFALFALLKRYRGQVTAALLVVLMIAAGLLLGDGIITPAISVLAAVEGLGVAAPALHDWIVPMTVIILTILFLIQQHGTHKIGRLFGPIILVWFISIAVLGLMQILKSAAILEAFNPLNAWHGLTMFPSYKLFIVLGSVMLVVTGGEALYADMGHFGKTPIRLSWFSIVMPCLLLNYLGQGAFLLNGGKVAGGSLFYSLVPSVLLVPMVILASLATVIASQALISGAYSLASQGVALGLFPRLRIKHTHEQHEGQIYIPFVNWTIYSGCIALVLTFRSSARLASAYGLAVSGVMVATTLTMLVIARRLWLWKRWMAVTLFLPLAAVDLLFLTANSLKFLEGGFIPLGIAMFLYLIMNTWAWGKHHWRETLSKHSTMSMRDVLKIKSKQPYHLERSLLVLTAEQPGKLKDNAPALLELFIKRFHVLPRHIINLTISQVRTPFVDPEKRYIIKEFENNHANDSSLLAITAQFGFLEEPDVEQVIRDIAANENLTPNDDMKDWIVYVARERVIAKGKFSFHRLRAIFYSILVNNSTPAYEYYGLGEDSRLSAELLPIKFR